MATITATDSSTPITDNDLTRERGPTIVSAAAEIGTDLTIQLDSASAIDVREYSHFFVGTRWYTSSDGSGSPIESDASAGTIIVRAQTECGAPEWETFAQGSTITASAPTTLNVSGHLVGFQATTDSGVHASAVAISGGTVNSWRLVITGVRQ